MKYDNKEMKIDEMIGYFNQGKVNLIPPFQRGSVWNLKLRKKLLVNMIQVRPIPAIFFYKQEEGAQFVYNILDGKQRLESLILFIGNQRPGLKIRNVENYFFGKPAIADSNFTIELDGVERSFADLDNRIVRTFREYAIPTIEINMDDESTSIDELVSLFIDINQEGVKVTRFDVVKALGRDPLFKQVFDLIAIKQVRKKKSRYYKAKHNNYAYVMKRLNIVGKLADKNSQVDRMWERLTEIALFARSGKHRAPADILKAFIKAGDELNPRMNKTELSKLRTAFDYLAAAYRAVPEFMENRFATDQPQFYTIVTLLLSSNMMTRFVPPHLANRLIAARKILEGKVNTPEGLDDSDIASYIDASTKQTTHPARRETRQRILVKAINAAGDE
jgi:hypothetical protein